MKPTVLLLCLIPTVAVSVPLGYVPTPAGNYKHPSCVVHVPSGWTVKPGPNGSSQLYPPAGTYLPYGQTFTYVPPCSYPAVNAIGQTTSALSTGPAATAADGWQASTFAKYPNVQVGAICADYIVPSFPAVMNGQILYFFNGLATDTRILQLVVSLRGTRYVIEPWQCDKTGNNCFPGDPIPASPVQDIRVCIHGNLCNTGNNICQDWYLTAHNMSAPDAGTNNATNTTIFHVGGNGEVVTAVYGNVVETYGVTQCAQMPVFGPASPIVQFPAQNTHVYKMVDGDAIYQAADGTWQWRYGAEVASYGADTFLWSMNPAAPNPSFCQIQALTPVPGYAGGANFLIDWRPQ